MKWEIGNINDLDKVTEYILNLAKERIKETDKTVVIALYGDLGSGKTTFTKQLAKDLNITETVTSPTFIIQKHFDIKDSVFEKLIHIDTYRIDLQDELVKLGWKENLNEKYLVAVEWPENIEDILPENVIRLYFSHADETTRLIEMR